MKKQAIIESAWIWAPITVVAAAAAAAVVAGRAVTK